MRTVIVHIAMCIIKDLLRVTYALRARIVANSGRKKGSKRRKIPVRVHTSTRIIADQIRRFVKRFVVIVVLPSRAFLSILQGNWMFPVRIRRRRNR